MNGKRAVQLQAHSVVLTPQRVADGWMGAVVVVHFHESLVGVAGQPSDGRGTPLADLAAKVHREVVQPCWIPYGNMHASTLEACRVFVRAQPLQLPGSATHVLQAAPGLPSGCRLSAPRNYCSTATSSEHCYQKTRYACAVAEPSAAHCLRGGRGGAAACSLQAARKSLCALPGNPRARAVLEGGAHAATHTLYTAARLCWSPAAAGSLPALALNCLRLQAVGKHNWLRASKSWAAPVGLINGGVRGE